MKKQKLALVLFWIGLLIAVAFAGIGTRSLMHNLRTLTMEELDATIWAEGGPLMILWGFSVALGSLLAGIGAGFVFAERFVSETGSVRYRIPESLRGALYGRRVLLVDDAVNAGSALLSTLTDLLDCGSELVGFAALLSLGEAASQIAKQHGAPLFTLASLEREMWAPEECP